VVSITIVSGNIVSTRADAIIASIGADGSWIGGVNHAIQQAAGTMFHDQLKAALPLTDGQVVLTVPDVPTYQGAFRSVLFLADMRAKPLGELLLPALHRADQLKVSRLSIPALRTGAAGWRVRTFYLRGRAAALYCRTRVRRHQPAAHPRDPVCHPR
jgi:O-acetyl-ADP-ribose deacetylase (regulator of RNase III)